jgi:hypothetical protein
MWPNWSTSPTRWRLLWAAVVSIVLPWLLGEFFKSLHQPGLDDNAQRSQMLIDFIVAGAILFGLTMVLTFAIGCWINAVMHGPRRDGDAFPAGQGSPVHDD